MMNACSEPRDKGPFDTLVKTVCYKGVNAAIRIAKSVFDRLKTAEKAAVNHVPKIVDNSLFLKSRQANCIKSEKLEDIPLRGSKRRYATLQTKSKGYIVILRIKPCEERTNQLITFKKSTDPYIVNHLKSRNIEELTCLLRPR